MALGRPPISDCSLQGQYEAVSLSLGRYGVFNAGIFIVKRRRDGKKFIQKRMKPEHIALGFSKFEMLILSELKHKNVVEYIDAFVVDRSGTLKGSLYMEYCEHGNLDQYLQAVVKRQEDWIAELAMCRLLEQLANAVAISNMEYMTLYQQHRRLMGQPSHGDSNNEQFPDVVLGDFGLAKRANGNGTWEQGAVGTDCYRAAPEWGMLDYGYAADVWSIGAVIQAACRLESDAFKRGPNGTPDGRVFWSVGAYYSKELDYIVEASMFRRPRGRPQMWELAPMIKHYSQKASRGKLTARMHPKP